nr:MAG: capsid protein [Cressdnaviricota sp.]
MDVVAFELARALTADLAGMKRSNPRNIPYRNEPVYARRALFPHNPVSARNVPAVANDNNAGRWYRGPNYNPIYASGAYSRSRTTGYSGYKRRRVGKRSYRTGRLAGRYRSTQGRLNKELKNFDNLGGFFPLSNTGALVLPSSQATGALLVGLGQGTSANTRTGRKILVKKVQVKGQVVFTPGAGAAGTDVFKWFLVHDKQANGAYPSSINDIWSVATTGAEMRNLDTTHRYRVLQTGSMEFQSGAGISGAYDPISRALDVEANCNCLVEMSSTAGAITEIKSNNLFFVCGTMNGLCIFSGSSRIRFYDQG